MIQMMPIVNVIITLLISICASIGNMVIIYVFTRNRSLQTINNIFILQLSIGDLLKALIILPTKAVTQSGRRQLTSNAFCQLTGCLSAVAFSHSAILFAAIAVVRYYKIVEPSSFAKNFSRSRVGTYSVVLLSIVLLFSLLPIIGIGKYEYSVHHGVCFADWSTSNAIFRIIFYMITMGMSYPVMIICYVMIFAKLRTHGCKLESSLRRSSSGGELTDLKTAEDAKGEAIAEENESFNSYSQAGDTDTLKDRFRPVDSVSKNMLLLVVQNSKRLESGDKPGIPGALGDGLTGDGLTGGGLIGDGRIGDGPIGDDLTGDGLIGDGLIGDGLIGDGLNGDGLTGDSLNGDGPIGDGLTGDGLIAGGLIPRRPFVSTSPPNNLIARNVDSDTDISHNVPTSHSSTPSNWVGIEAGSTPCISVHPSSPGIPNGYISMDQKNRYSSQESSDVHDQLEPLKFNNPDSRKEDSTLNYLQRQEDISPNEVQLLEAEKEEPSGNDHELLTLTESQKSNLSQSLTKRTRHKMSDMEIQVTKLMFIIVLVFTLCWFPAFLVNILMLTKTAQPSDNVLFGIITLVDFKVLLNPLIYGLGNPKFRNAIIKCLYAA